MEHSPATRSTSRLPPHAANARRSKGITDSRSSLSASISAAALLHASDAAGANSKTVAPSPSAAKFAITDLLKSTSDATLLPLSPIKHSSIATTSPSLPLSVFTETAERQQSQQQQQKAHSQYLKRLEDPENVELFAYASALCHRITGKYLPKTVLQSDADAQKHEIERIQRDPEILKAISAIRTLSTQFKSVARDTMGHRKELGHALFRIEEGYLKLFEKLMEISLRMYWKYEQDRESERAADKASIVHWKELHAWKKAECAKLEKLLDGNAVVLKTQQIQLRDLEAQLDEVNRELAVQRDLERQVRELTRVEDELRTKERTLQGELERLQTKHDEMMAYERTQQELMREQQKRTVNEMKNALREKDAVILKQDTAIRELSVEPVPVTVVTSSTQTEVDDDGLWDAQDGIPRYVSKSTLHRMLWRRFNAFVTCKNCHGRPIASSKGAGNAQLRADDGQDFVEVWSLNRRTKLSTKEAKRIESIEQQWQLPDSIRLFLSNLPKSAMAFPFYSLEHVITQIEAIYDDKFTSDLADEADGVAREELPKFICEYFLKTCGLRQSAEVALYRLLISVKNAYRRNSHVRLFARFLNLLHDRDTALERRSTEDGASGRATATVAAVPSKTKRSGYLNMSFLHVFLTARHYLLRPPPPVPLTSKTKGGTKSRRAPDNSPHVIQREPTKSWVSLDHAIATLKWYISYLPDESVVSYCREVEYSTAIFVGGAINEVSGNRLAVRAEMRRAMLASEASDGASSSAADEKDRKLQPRIVADVHRVLLLLLDALEQRQEVMERDLVALFDAGDTNHDCVLSFTEFKAIILTRVPHFSDRRILRMFREALMGGEDQSFALSMAAFVSVCSDHGLVSLLPDDRLRDPFERKKRTLRALIGAKEPSGTAAKLSSALDALLSPAQRLAAATAKKADDARANADAPVELLELPGAMEIPEELHFSARESDTAPVSARADEVEDDDEDAWG